MSGNNSIRYAGLTMSNALALLRADILRIASRRRTRIYDPERNWSLEYMDGTLNDPESAQQTERPQPGPSRGHSESFELQDMSHLRHARDRQVEPISEFPAPFRGPNWPSYRAETLVNHAANVQETTWSSTTSEETLVGSDVSGRILAESPRSRPLFEQTGRLGRRDNIDIQTNSRRSYNAHAGSEGEYDADQYANLFHPRPRRPILSPLLNFPRNGIFPLPPPPAAAAPAAADMSLSGRRGQQCPHFAGYEMVREGGRMDHGIFRSNPNPTSVGTAVPRSRGQAVGLMVSKPGVERNDEREEEEDEGKEKETEGRRVDR